MPLVGEFKKYVNLADAMGFTHEYNARNGYIFSKGNVRIWQIRDGWQVADCVDGYYKNHRPYRYLDTALIMESMPPAKKAACIKGRTYKAYWTIVYEGWMIWEIIDNNYRPVSSRSFKDIDDAWANAIDIILDGGKDSDALNGHDCEDCVKEYCPHHCLHFDKMIESKNN